VFKKKPQPSKFIFHNLLHGIHGCIRQIGGLFRDMTIIFTMSAKT